MELVVERCAAKLLNGNLIVIAIYRYPSGCFKTFLEKVECTWSDNHFINGKCNLFRQIKSRSSETYKTLNYRPITLRLNVANIF